MSVRDPRNSTLSWMPSPATIRSICAGYAFANQAQPGFQMRAPCSGFKQHGSPRVQRYIDSFGIIHPCYTDDIALRSPAGIRTAFWYRLEPLGIDTTRNMHNLLVRNPCEVR